MTTTTPARVNPFELGYEAARNGIEIWQNPYSPYGNKGAYDQWNAGWHRWGRNILSQR